jgi:hypothetical protein
VGASRLRAPRVGQLEEARPRRERASERVALVAADLLQAQHRHAAGHHLGRQRRDGRRARRLVRVGRDHALVEVFGVHAMQNVPGGEAQGSHAGIMPAGRPPR